MAGAQPDNVWVTLQAHMNVVAVASLREVAAVIITENAQPEPDVIAKANDQNVTLLSTSAPSYEVAGRLWEMGIR
jgi:predicted transcriptional regulator